MRDEMYSDIVRPQTDLPTRSINKTDKWPDLSVTLVHMGGKDMGEVKAEESLPATMGEEAREGLLKEKPIKLFVFPEDIKIYVGRTDKPDQTISVAIFQGEEYLVYDDEYTIDRLLKKILDLSGVIRLKTEKEGDETIN